MLYSETRRGNLSSCFGHVNKDRKLYFDLVYGRFFEMDLNDNIVFISNEGEIAAILANGFVEQLNQNNIFQLLNFYVW